MSKENHIEVEELQAKLTQAESQAEENLNGWKRALADYSNFKKEQEKRQKEIIEFANASAVAEFLPIYSHYKLALKQIPAEAENQDWVKGVEQIQKQFQEVLKNYDIEEIKTVGEKFNPELHEAVAHEEKEGFESDVIFEETQAGYTLGGKVINPAKVKVAK